MDPEPPLRSHFLDDLVISAASARRARRPRVRGTVPRVLNLFITPDKVYRCTGSTTGSTARSPARPTASSTHSLRWHLLRRPLPALAGLRPSRGAADRLELRRGRQARHPVPQLGRQRNDGRGRLSIINADFSSTSFRLSRVSIGAENFLGNRIAYPAQGRTGDNCLLATSKVMVPLDGPVRKAWAWARPASRFRGRSSATAARRDERGRAAPRPHGEEHLQHHHHDAVPADQWILFFAVTVLYLAAVDLWANLGALRSRWPPPGPGLQRRLQRPDRPAGPAAHGLAAAGLLDLRPRILAARTLRSWVPTPISRLQRHPVQERALAAGWVCGSAAGSSTTASGAPERTFTAIGDDCTPQYWQRHPVPLAGGRRVQVRPQRDRCRLHARCRRMGPLRRDDGRRHGARRRLLPHEGRGNATNELWGGNPAKDARALGRPSGPKDQHRRRRAAVLVAAADTRANVERRDDSMDKRVETGREFWRAVLLAGGATAIPRWTLDPAPGVAEHVATLDDETSRRRCRLADELALPLHSVALAAHAKVLAALSGEQDVVTGYAAGPGGGRCPARSPPKPAPGDRCCRTPLGSSRTCSSTGTSRWTSSRVSWAWPGRRSRPSSTRSAASSTPRQDQP